MGPPIFLQESSGGTKEKSARSMGRRADESGHCKPLGYNAAPTNWNGYHRLSCSDHYKTEQWMCSVVLVDCSQNYR